MFPGLPHGSLFCSVDKKRRMWKSRILCGINLGPPWGEETSPGTLTEVGRRLAGVFRGDASGSHRASVQRSVIGATGSCVLPDAAVSSPAARPSVMADARPGGETRHPANSQSTAILRHRPRPHVLSHDRCTGRSALSCPLGPVASDVVCGESADPGYPSRRNDPGWPRGMDSVGFSGKGRSLESGLGSAAQGDGGVQGTPAK
jgi:hypothetical protein